MDDLLWPRVLSTFAVDASLALLCGLWLCGLWLGDKLSQANGRQQNTKGLRIFAALLVVAFSFRLILLAASFSGQTSLYAVIASMPDVGSTHAGSLSFMSCGVALLLAMGTLIPSARFRPIVCGVLIVTALCIHAATGHAASNGDFSLGELLQVVHLLGMAVWSGSVIVSGLAIAPRLQRQASRETTLASPSFLAVYLGRLSLASTWSVGAVILSGLIKAGIATGSSLHVMRSSQWGQALLVKGVFVTLTVLLGARNRWLLASNKRHRALDCRGVVQTLRFEAFSMLAVLVLSAWLANTSPPLD